MKIDLISKSIHLTLRGKCYFTISLPLLLPRVFEKHYKLIFPKKLQKNYSLIIGDNVHRMFDYGMESLKRYQKQEEYSIEDMWNDSD